MRLAVTGGTGFVGRHVVRTLVQRGHAVRLLARDPGRAPFAPDVPLERIAGTLADHATLRRLAAGVDALIHLVGIIVERGRDTFEAVHVEGTRAVVAAARAAACRRLIYMSALGARDEPGATPYHRTKARAERIVLDAGVPATVFRPSIISGPESPPLRMLARLHRLLPAVPVFGNGSYPVQPVWIDDVALACALAAETHHESAIHELGGPRPMTYTDFVRAIGRAAGRPRPVIHVPLPLVRLAAAGFDLLGPHAPLTSDQLQMLVEGSATKQNALPTVFGIEPLAFEEGLSRFLP